MRTLVHRFCALLLVLTFWSATAAHALGSEPVESLAHAYEHVGGSGEDEGSAEDSGSPVHNHGCHGHGLGLISDPAGDRSQDPRAEVPVAFELRVTPPARAGPMLRPPIA